MNEGPDTGQPLDTHHSAKTAPTGPDGNALLPAAAALADNLANPTTTQIGANLLVWDSGASIWRRALNNLGDAANGAGILSVANMLNNGTGGGAQWDRHYNNIQGTLLASAARTTTTISPTQTNFNAKGVILFLNVTAASGTGGLQLSLAASAPSGATADLTMGKATAVTATGRYALVAYPGATTASNDIKLALADPVPRSWYSYVQHNDSSSYTYALDYALIN
ncbi:MAG: hypothetical protein KGL39_12080 [Patescibacteria group bacterium]|nr:hypothetical protein [Patescibacteria group bacterium]